MPQVVCASGFIKPTPASELCPVEISGPLTGGQPRKGKGEVETGRDLMPSQWPVQFPVLAAFPGCQDTWDLFGPLTL